MKIPITDILLIAFIFPIWTLCAACIFPPSVPLLSAAIGCGVQFILLFIIIYTLVRYTEARFFPHEATLP